MGIDIVAAPLFLDKDPAVTAYHYRFAQPGEDGGEIGIVGDEVILVIVGNHEESDHHHFIDVEYLAWQS